MLCGSPPSLIRHLHGRIQCTKRWPRRSLAWAPKTVMQSWFCCLFFLCQGPLKWFSFNCTHFLPGKSHGWRSLVGCSPWGRTESDMTERLSSSTSYWWGKSRSWSRNLWVAKGWPEAKGRFWPRVHCLWLQMFRSRAQRWVLSPLSSLSSVPAPSNHTQPRVTHQRQA